ncbi:MAG: 4Fe-4S binding protein [Archaeoglobus sp.]|nr:4Fe-4S binding protein [Archaeoglobus sp.]
MLLYLHFDSKTVKEPVISLTTLEKKTLINIIRGSVGAREGELFVEIEDSRASEIIEFIRSKGVEVTEIREKIAKSEDCIHCGACISICPVEVFSLNDDFRVEAEVEKCIRCGICIYVCPVKALELPSI